MSQEIVSDNIKIQQILNTIKDYDLSIKDYDELRKSIELMQMDCDDAILNEYKFKKKMIETYRLELEELRTEMKKRGLRV